MVLFSFTLKNCILWKWRGRDFKETICHSLINCKKNLWKCFQWNNFIFCYIILVKDVHRNLPAKRKQWKFFFIFCLVTNKLVDWFLKKIRLLSRFVCFIDYFKNYNTFQHFIEKETLQHSDCLFLDTIKCIKSHFFCNITDITDQVIHNVNARIYIHRIATGPKTRAYKTGIYFTIFI